MRNPLLELMDLVLGLERFGDRYSAIQVFADDVLEAHSAEPVPGLSGLDREERCYRSTVPEGKSHAGESYELDLPRMRASSRCAEPRKTSPRHRGFRFGTD